MQAQTQIHKPSNWQDFETLCMKLWGRIWDCADTIKKNGRAGQKQHGVDILGKKKGENLFSAIQCKGKDDYTNSKLTKILLPFFFTIQCSLHRVYQIYKYYSSHNFFFLVSAYAWRIG